MEAVADHRAVGVRAVVVSHLGQELRLATRGHGGDTEPGGSPTAGRTSLCCGKRKPTQPASQGLSRSA